MNMHGRKCDLGLIGVGVMGANLALNIADHGFSIAVYDATSEKTREFMETVGERGIAPAYSMEEFASLLSSPRSVIVLVPAGGPVDSVIEGLLPFLDGGDLVVDGGNSHFTDTDRRSRGLAEKGFLFMGMGISGGEYGARHGPSMMPGGPREGYERLEPVLRRAAAQVGGEPCVAYMGAGAAGHYVKMVHNGIEYGLMQSIAETYDVMKRGLKMDPDALAAVYEGWNRSDLSGYLLEITARIFRRGDDKKPGAFLIDSILDRAMQKGTGMWTSQDAMDLQVPIPGIDAAVAARNLSALLCERGEIAGLSGGGGKFRGDRDRLVDRLRGALHAAMLLTYAQGFALLGRASAERGYRLDLEAVARVWRGGCIIRSALLAKIRAAYQTAPELSNLLLDPGMARQVASLHADLRAVAQTAAEMELPVPCMMASLAYYDACRSRWLPANLIQAQRDFFGSHTYERTDAPGFVHTDWSIS